MLVEKARKYYDKKYDLNCAETIIYAANEEYSLGLSKETLKALAGFGGGLCVEHICGAITGAIAVIGIMYTDEKSHQSPIVKELTQKFMNNFKDKLQEYNCDKLKEKYKKDEEFRCLYMVESSAEILQDLIDEQNK